jgi:hypothetical protein
MVLGLYQDTVHDCCNYYEGKKQRYRACRLKVKTYMVKDPSTDSDPYQLSESCLGDSAIPNAII